MPVGEVDRGAVELGPEKLVQLLKDKDSLGVGQYLVETLLRIRNRLHYSYFSDASIETNLSAKKRDYINKINDLLENRLLTASEVSNFIVNMDGEVAKAIRFDAEQFKWKTHQFDNNQQKILNSDSYRSTKGQISDAKKHIAFPLELINAMRISDDNQSNKLNKRALFSLCFDETLLAAFFQDVLKHVAESSLDEKTKLALKVLIEEKLYQDDSPFERLTTFLGAVDRLGASNALSPFVKQLNEDFNKMLPDQKALFKANWMPDPEMAKKRSELLEQPQQNLITSKSAIRDNQQLKQQERYKADDFLKLYDEELFINSMVGFMGNLCRYVIDHPKETTKHSKHSAVSQILVETDRLLREPGAPIERLRSLLAFAKQRNRGENEGELAIIIKGLEDKLANVEADKLFLEKNWKKSTLTKQDIDKKIDKVPYFVVKQYLAERHTGPDGVYNTKQATKWTQKLKNWFKEILGSARKEAHASMQQIENRGSHGTFFQSSNKEEVKSFFSHAQESKPVPPLDHGKGVNKKMEK